jgi:ClpP class serine protease
METTTRSRWYTVWLSARSALFLVLGLAVLQQMCSPLRLAAARDDLLERLQQKRQSRVIAMIHREDTVSLFGVPVSRSIGIEDSEAVLRAIRLTPADQPIDLVLHTPGGLVLAAEQIALALLEHTGKVTVFVPHYAMSGGTLLALTADEIVMDPHAVLGPVDPQIGAMPAASIVKLLELKSTHEISDEMLVLTDVAQKARVQVAAFVDHVLLKHLPRERAAVLATALSEGRWTHDFPITVDAARQMGLSISTDMPELIYELMDLYPQSGQGRPSVIYVPLRPPVRAPHASPGEPQDGQRSSRQEWR